MRGMVTFRLLVTPNGAAAQARREAFRRWMQADGRQAERHKDASVDMYLVDLAGIYLALLTLRELGITATEFRVELARTSGRQPQTTALALTRKVSAIEMALLTVNDLRGLGHIVAENDLRVIVEALLLLLHTTQQQLGEQTPQ